MDAWEIVFVKAGVRFFMNFWSEIVFVPGGVALAGISWIWRFSENLRDWGSRDGLAAVGS